MQILYFAGIRELTKEKERQCPVPVATVHELLLTLSARYGTAFRQKVFNGDGQLSDVVIVLVNGRDIRHLNGLETPLATADTVCIFPVVAGG